MNKTDYYRAVVFGAIIGMSFLAIFYTLDTTMTTKNSKPPKPESNFEVVDHYKGCDLVRWSDRGLAEYKYVLHCPK